MFDISDKALNLYSEAILAPRVLGDDFLAACRGFRFSPLQCQHPRIKPEICSGVNNIRARVFTAERRVAALRHSPDPRSGFCVPLRGSCCFFERSALQLASHRDALVFFVFFFPLTFPKQPWWRAIKKLNMLGAVSGGRIEKYWKSRKGGGDSKREGNYLFSRRDITRRRPCTHRKHLSPARCVQVVTYSASASFVCLMCASTPL